MTALAPSSPAPAAAPAIPAASGPWKRVSAAMTAQMPALAAPVTVICAPGAGHGHPACYFPQSNHAEVSARLLGPVSPSTVRPASPADRDRYPVAWGALVHEAGHAAHTRVPFPPAQRANWCDAAHQLEESRMEAAQLARRPADRRWLRATATRLILDDFTAAGAVAGSPREAGSAAALMLAREHAGVLEAAETAPVAAAVTAAIGRDALARLRATWEQAHALADDDAPGITRLARRWCRILGTDPDAPPPAPEPITASAIGAAITAAAGIIAAAVADDFAPVPAFPPGRQAERAAENIARAGADAAARQVFGAGSPAPGAVTGTRPPAPGEQAAARSLARALRGATAGTRATTTVTSAVPPGRLRMREVMANDARRAAGARPDARPFTRTTSRRVAAPPLRAGIACDISGSMAGYTGPVASASWILARAASALPAATTATVLFGEQVGALTRPGRAPARVTTFAAPDGYEKVAEAIDALDGALGLARPGTARLLAIVSDCRFRPEQAAAARQRITRLAAAGCGVIILRPEDAPGSTDWPGAQVITITDPAATIALIARAATCALTT